MKKAGSSKKGIQLINSSKTGEHKKREDTNH